MAVRDGPSLKAKVLTLWPDGVQQVNRLLAKGITLPPEWAYMTARRATSAVHEVY